MAGGASNYLCAKALDRLLRGTAYTPPANIYASPVSTMPDDAGAGGVEITQAGAGRLVTTFGSYANRQLLNAAPANWTAGENWPNPVVGLALYDALSGGNFLQSMYLESELVVQGGDPFRFAVGEMVLQISKLGPYLCQQIMELMFRGIAKSQITTYAHLCTTAPSDDGVGAVVVAAGDYAPKLVPAWAAFNVSTGRSNLAADLSFTTGAASNWGRIAAYMIRDSASPAGGNFLGQGAISPQPTVSTGDQYALSAPDTYIGLD